MTVGVGKKTSGGEMKLSQMTEEMYQRKVGSLWLFGNGSAL